MAPRIVDLQNATDIYRIFTFDSDKEKQRISYEIADNPCKTMDNDNFTSNEIISKFLFLLHYTLNR